MEKGHLIRFRIDPEIRERAYRMAAEAGLELPDIMRMMLAKAVRIGDFSIDRDEVVAASNAQPDALFEPFAPRYWSEIMPALDAETAVAMLEQAIAERTTELQEGVSLSVPDTQRLDRVRDERNEACALLATFDPTDPKMVARILQKFGPASDPDSAPEDGL